MGINRNLRRQSSRGINDQAIFAFSLAKLTDLN